MRQILILISFGIILSSCGASKRVQKRNNNSNVSIPNGKTPKVTTVKITPTFNSTQQYINFFKSEAIHEMKLYGIPASITLAQGILESGSGKGRLAVEANNHFGIKCHDWNGKKIFHDDDKKQECFRKYDNPEYSYRDHSIFLSNRGRYSFLFDLKKDDYKKWARGLKKAGYATDPKYSQKLIDLIERHELYKYDNKVLKKKNKLYKVKRGDTVYSISKKFNMPVDLIIKMNNIKDYELSVGETIIIKK